MIQEILTYSLVAWAFIQVILFFYRIFKPGNSKSACGGGGCPSCTAKNELFKDIQKGRLPQLMKQD